MAEAETPVEAESSAEAEVQTDSAKAPATDSEQAISDTIMVHVCGAVLCEGVYELPTGSRVVDAVRAAGGFTGEADSDYINQALVLSDGVKVKIPTVDETMTALQNGEQTTGSFDQESDMAGITGMYDEEGSSSKSDDGKVNINTADETQLCTIPGIGPGRAKNIIAYREEKGRFGTIEDIMKVSGIKDKFFSKIKEYITV